MIILKQSTQILPTPVQLPDTETGFWINEDTSGVWNLKFISIPFNESNLDYKNQLAQIERFIITYTNYSTFNSKIEIDYVQKLSTHFYYKIKNTVRIPTALVSLDNQLSGVDLFFGEPSFEEEFDLNNYDIGYGNINSNRISYKFFNLEKLKSQLQPTNLEYILENYTQDPTQEVLYRSLGQDSNYSSHAWKNPRYDGVLNPTRIEGKEPALSVYSFEGVLFPKTATTSSILQPPYDLTEAKRIYYNRNRDLLDATSLLNYRTNLETSEGDTRECFGQFCDPDILGSLTITYFNNEEVETDVLNNINITLLLEYVNYDGTRSYFEDVVLLPSGSSSTVYTGIYPRFSACGFDTCEYAQINFVKIVKVQGVAGEEEVIEGPTEAELVERGNTFFYIDKDINKDLVNLVNTKVLSLKTKRIYELDEFGKVTQIY
jgi:hypothetical protein